SAAPSCAPSWPKPLSPTSPCASMWKNSTRPCGSTNGWALPRLRTKGCISSWSGLHGCNARRHSLRQRLALTVRSRSRPPPAGTAEARVAFLTRPVHCAYATLAVDPLPSMQCDLAHAGAPMAETDSLLKRLVSTFVLDFAAWLLGTAVQTVRPLPSELPASTVTVDQVFLVTLTDGREVLLHIEFQGRRSPTPMQWRMLDYMPRLASAYRLDMESVVLYI